MYITDGGFIGCWFLALMESLVFGLFYAMYISQSMARLVYLLYLNHGGM